MAVWTVKQDGTGDAITIQGGVNLASPGDTVDVYSGDYGPEEVFPTGALQTDITIRVPLGESAILDGGGAGGIGIQCYTNWLIDAAPDNPDHPAYPVRNTGSLTIRNYDCGISGWGSSQVFEARVDLIEGCTVGIYRLATGATVPRARIHNTLSHAIHTTPAEVPIIGSEGVEILGCGDGIAANSATVRHVTVAEQTGGAFAINCATGDVQFCNVQDCNSGGISGSNGYNNVFAVTGLAYDPAPQPTDIQADSLPMDAPAGDWRPSPGSPVIGAATGSIATIDAGGAERPSPAAIGAWETPVVSILSINTPDTRTIVVTLSGPVSGGSLLVPGAWSAIATDGASDDAEISAVAQDGTGAIITLTTEDDMTPGGLYDLTPPGDVPTLTASSVPFVVTAWGPDPPQEPILEATMGAITARLADVYGAPRTRLRRALAPGDTVAYVESCYGMPTTAGRIRIGREKEATYTTRTGRRLEGLVRSDEWTTLETHPVKTEVIDDSLTYSMAARVFSESNPATCPDDALESVARMLGFPRPLRQMTDEDLRRYLTTRYYLEAGSWWAMFQVLRHAFRWASRTGANGVVRHVAGPPSWVYLDVPEASLPFSSALQQRWIYVDGRLCRVATAYEAPHHAPATTTLLLYAHDGPYWQGAAPLADGATVDWELLAFRHQEGQFVPAGGNPANNRVGLVRIQIFSPSSSGLGGTYLLSAGLTSASPPPGRYPRGKLSASAAVYPRPGRQGFYLSNPYARTTRRTLVDVVAAGVEVEVKSLGH